MRTEELNGASPKAPAFTPALLEDLCGRDIPATAAAPLRSVARSLSVENISSMFIEWAIGALLDIAAAQTRPTSSTLQSISTG